MHRFLTVILAAVLLLASATVGRAQNNNQEPDMDQIINTQLENLTRMFKLDDVQVFFVDSILQYNFPAMNEEFDQTRLLAGRLSAILFLVSSSGGRSPTIIGV